jgi:hypothetical protein
MGWRWARAVRPHGGELSRGKERHVAYVRGKRKRGLGWLGNLGPRNV